MKRRWILLALLLVVFPMSPSGAQHEEEHAAFKVFDNLYYVGINFVAAYLVPTSDGLVLIDAAYDNSVDHLLKGVREMGFDPADIKHIIVTHWHADHFGGAERIHALCGAPVSMIEKDWESRFFKHSLSEDAVVKIRDGDSLTVGDTTFEFMHVPGHTLGTLGITFTVYDDGTPHKAFTYGGTGLNFSGLEQTRMYIDSLKRVMALEGIEVNVANHQDQGDVFARYAQLKERKPGEAHAFVDPEGFTAWLDRLMVGAEKKLGREEEKAARAKR